LNRTCRLAAQLKSTWRSPAALSDQARLQVQDCHQGEADLLVTADSATWLDFLAKSEACCGPDPETRDKQ
jgi:hypothetical protein